MPPTPSHHRRRLPQSINYAYDEHAYPTDDNDYRDSSSPAGRFNKRPSSPTEPSPTAKRPQYQRQQSTVELFAKYIATSLDALPPRLAVWAQKDLHDVLVKYKLMEFDGTARDGDEPDNIIGAASPGRP